MSQITPNVFQILPTLKASQHHIAAMAKRAPLCKAKQTKRRLVHSPPRRKQSHTPQTLWLRCHFSRALPTDLPHYISFWDPPFHRVSIDPSCHGMEKPHDPPPPMGMVLACNRCRGPPSASSPDQTTPPQGDDHFLPSRLLTAAHSCSLLLTLAHSCLLLLTLAHSCSLLLTSSAGTNARCAPLLAKGSVGAGAEQAVHEGGGPQAHHAGPLHPAAVAFWTADSDVTERYTLSRAPSCSQPLSGLLGYAGVAGFDSQRSKFSVSPIDVIALLETGSLKAQAAAAKILQQCAAKDDTKSHILKSGAPDVLQRLLQYTNSSDVKGACQVRTL
eukprot:924230-Prorocentrum_minimum.AAC.19